MHRESIAEAEVASADDVRSLAAHARAEMVIQQQLSQKGAKNVEAVEMKNTEAAEKVAALLPKIKAAATFDELEKLLKEPAVIATTSRRADAVQRCMGYCKLARLKELSKDDGEVMLQGGRCRRSASGTSSRSACSALDQVPVPRRVQGRPRLAGRRHARQDCRRRPRRPHLARRGRRQQRGHPQGVHLRARRQPEPARRDREARAREAEHEREYDLRDYKHSAKETIVPVVIASIVAAHPSWAATASCR